MRKRIVKKAMLERFYTYLTEDEKSLSTINKYMRDVKFFSEFIGERPVIKSAVLEYKNKLCNCYSARSVNSMLASLNSFFRFAGWSDFCVKQLKIQNEAYCSNKKELTRSDYLRLIETAEKNGNFRLSLVIQTICATGIRVSELENFTVEAVKNGEVVVSLKGKTRKIFIVSALRDKLLDYAFSHGITKGAIFITKSGKPLDRSNIWRDMKRLCESTCVSGEKVFPHNLRHLFARTFYGIDKDISKLSDLLGHSSINTTRIYIISSGTEHRQKMEEMSLVI